jgi:hypothetical protein
LTPAGRPHIARVWFQRLKLKYDEPLLHFAVNVNSRHYTTGRRARETVAATTDTVTAAATPTDSPIHTPPPRAPRPPRRRARRAQPAADPLAGVDFAALFTMAGAGTDTASPTIGRPSCV